MYAYIIIKIQHHHAVLLHIHMHMHLCIFFTVTVPGITGSQLHVMHNNRSSRCDTEGKSVGLWISFRRLLTHEECVSPELR